MHATSLWEVLEEVVTFFGDTFPEIPSFVVPDCLAGEGQSFCEFTITSNVDCKRECRLDLFITVDFHPSHVEVEIV